MSKHVTINSIFKKNINDNPRKYSLPGIWYRTEAQIQFIKFVSNSYFGFSVVNLLM